MEKVYILHQQLLSNLKPIFRREFIDEISWDESGVALMGARGVGKTTLMLQYIKERFKSSTSVLYVSMDHIVVQEHSLYDIAVYHSNNGGTHLFVDEIHKYEGWSIHLKSIYDTYPNLNVIVSGSSMLQLYKSKADLSRRYVSYELRGLSFREYLEIEHKVALDSYALEEILENHLDITHEINEKVDAFQNFKSYLKHGYYPIYMKGTKTYGEKLQNVLNTILEIDIPYVTGVQVQNVHKIKKLISIIAKSVPFQPNITKLAAALELNRTTLYQYIDYLVRARIITAVNSPGKSYTVMNKPDKIYLHNTNIAYSFGEQSVNIGSIRETFFLNQLEVNHRVSTAKKGDFTVDEKYIFEIGGPSKNYKQVVGLEGSYIAADEMPIGFGNKIPLWLFGFLKL